MESIDLVNAEGRARRAYELGRARRALLGFAPVLLLASAAACLSERSIVALSVGMGLFGFGAVLLWRGRDVGRAVLPGVLAGAIPLVFALCARHLHACTDDVCMTFCVPACMAGGLLAGLFVSAVGLRHDGGVGFWLGATGIALLTGAMGCSCAGYSGVVGLGAGYVVGVAPGVLRAFLMRKGTAGA